MSVEALISTQVIDTTSVGRSVMTAADAAAVRTAADAQVTLVSGTNIKTINSTSLLGSGDIVVSASPGGSTTQLQYNDAGSFGGTAAVAYATTVTHVTMTAQGATIVPLVVKGAASQSGNLTEWQNSSGTVLASLNSAGSMTIPAGQKYFLRGTNHYISSTGDSQIDFYAFGINSLNITQSRVTIPDSLYFGGIGLSYPNIKTAATTDTNTVGTKPLFINSQNGYPHNSTSFNTPGDININCGYGGAAASGNTNGGNAASLNVVLRNGGAASGTGTAGANGKFSILDGSSVEHFSVSNAGNVVANGTVINKPASSVTLATNGQLSVEMTSNTAGNLVYRGSDGVTRRCALVFA